MRKTKISWTESTWNPWRGCTKVSAACKFCYMYRIYNNRGINPELVVRQDLVFDAPLRDPKGKFIFTCSMSDFFHENADEWRNEAWEVIRKCPHHTFLILTKRPERVKDCLPENWNKENFGHVWLGVTIESQKELHRIHTLSEVPCAIRWVSFEPLLGEIKLSEEETKKIHWAIIGGESGSKAQARKSELSWFNSLIFQLMGAGVAVFFKQFGSQYHYDDLKLRDWHGEQYCDRFPDMYKIRQYPIYKYGEKEINFFNVKKAS